MVGCDCMNFCGDDPWLKDGRAMPCERLQNERAAEAKAKDDAHQIKLSAIAVGEWLNGGCNPKNIPDTHIKALVHFTSTATTGEHGNA